MSATCVVGSLMASAARPKRATSTTTPNIPGNHASLILVSKSSSRTRRRSARDTPIVCVSGVRWRPSASRLRLGAAPQQRALPPT
eukprot:6841856-Prymnesium_polylepis.1